MYTFSQDVASKLNLLQQRKLAKGEIFLLAKAITDSIPLAPVDTDNIALFTLNHRNFINEVVFSLAAYTYLDDEAVKTIYRLIDELSLWRFNIAHNPPVVIYQGDTNTVVDDTTCIMRYVDTTFICSVADIADKANWVYSMFRDIAFEIKAQAKQ